MVEEGATAALRARLRRVVLEELMATMARTGTPPEARDTARRALLERLQSGSIEDMPDLEAAVASALTRPTEPRPAGSLREAPRTPPGSPIGGGGGFSLMSGGASGCSLDVD